MTLYPAENRIETLTFPNLVREELVGLGPNRMTVYRGDLLAAMDGLNAFISTHTDMSPPERRYIMGITAGDQFYVTSSLLEGGLVGHEYLESYLPQATSGDGSVRFLLAHYRFSETSLLNVVKVLQWTGNRTSALYLATDLIRNAPDFFMDSPLNVLVDGAVIAGKEVDGIEVPITIAKVRPMLALGKNINTCFTETWKV